MKDDAFSQAIRPIGRMASCFGQKFGVPRQPGLVEEARGVLTLEKSETYREALHGLEGFSHLWVIFLFHQVAGRDWSPRVRPPRLGGEKSLGVFATRSPFRPNPIGLSALRYHGVQERADALELHFSGVDVVDGTPVLDIKPYLPYADSLPEATVPEAFTLNWPSLKVDFDEKARVFLASMGVEQGSNLEALIIACLRQDPRPAVHRRGNTERDYSVLLNGYDVDFRVSEDRCRVVDIRQT